VKAKTNIGGQAVIEGVMMRGSGCIATAVREPSGSITVKKEPLALVSERYPLLKKPMLRGVVALVESLVYGLKALSFSAQASGEEEEQLTTREIVLTMAFAFGLAVLLFVIIPTWAAKFIHSASDEPMVLNLFEGLLRLAIFFAYVAGISVMKDIRRVFQYHGAEHKTIHAYEAGVPLDVEHVRPFSTLHPRCGTNFLLIVMLVSVFVFAFLGWPDLWLRIASRVALLPLIAGIGYEVIRFAGRSDKRWVAVAITPGLWLQKLTTREPSDDMIEVAICALEAVKPDGEVKMHA
jgi:Predicted metal-dependent enzyme